MVYEDDGVLMSAKNSIIKLIGSHWDKRFSVCKYHGFTSSTLSFIHPTVPVENSFYPIQNHPDIQPNGLNAKAP